MPDALQKHDGMTAVAVELHRVGDRGMRPSELLTLLGYSIESCHVLRLRTRFSAAMAKAVSTFASTDTPLNAK